MGKVWRIRYSAAPTTTPPGFTLASLLSKRPELPRRLALLGRFGGRFDRGSETYHHRTWRVRESVANGEADLRLSGARVICQARLVRRCVTAPSGSIVRGPD